MLTHGLKICQMLCLIVLLAIAKGAVAGTPHLITPFLPNAQINVPYSGKLMISSMTTGTETASVAGLPPGLIFTHDVGNIVISGTPTVGGAFPLTVTAAIGSAFPLTITIPSFRVEQFATNVSAISAGATHTCVVVNGGVQCWGFNGSGELGNNSIAASSVAVRAITPGSGATAVSAGSSHTCAVVAGGLQCWGANSGGQLGNNSNAQSLVPVSIFPRGNLATKDIPSFVHCWDVTCISQILRSR